MPTKKYKAYVSESIDIFNLEELETMKKSLQSLGIIEKVNMFAHDVEA